MNDEELLPGMDEILEGEEIGGWAFIPTDRISLSHDR